MSSIRRGKPRVKGQDHVVRLRRWATEHPDLAVVLLAVILLAVVLLAGRIPVVVYAPGSDIHVTK